MRLRVEGSFSELVFEQLGLRDVGLRARDVTREEIGLKIEGLGMKFNGNFALRVRISTADIGEKGKERWSKSWRSSGRISAEINETKFAFSTRFVLPLPSSPSRISLVHSALDLGQINSLKLEGFGRFAPIIARLVSAFSTSIVVRWPADRVFGIMLREALEDEIMSEEVEKVWELVKAHLDAEGSWAELTEEDRAKEEEMFAAPSEVDDKKEGTKKKEPHFHLSGFLHGRTHLQSFPLPPFSPSLYREGGARALLQQFNMITNEINFSLTDSSLESIVSQRGEVDLELDVDGGVLTVDVRGLEVVLKSTFEIFAETTSLVAWTTGIKKIGEKGISTTIVKATTLTLKFILTRSPLSLRNTFVLRTASISPFTSIIPSFTLHTTPKLGVELVNALTKSLSSEIAVGSSFVVRRFMESFVRDGLQGMLDGVEETLAQNGVVLPTAMRNS